MKALEILASLYKDVLHWENRGISCTNTSFELKEAIAELEALQVPKTCETCKHNDGDCAVLELLQDAFGFESDNCICPNYEPKEEK